MKAVRKINKLKTAAKPINLIITFLIFLPSQFFLNTSIRVVNGLWLLVKTCVGVQFIDHP